MSNKAIVREFIELWPSLDAGKLSQYFAEDGVYHNMPADPVKGRAEIEQFIGAFTDPWKSTDWEIVTLVEDGDTVIAERVDRIDFGTKQLELPCVGVFEMENGKIKVWRDYFDLGSYMKAFEG